MADFTFNGDLFDQDNLFDELLDDLAYDDAMNADSLGFIGKDATREADTQQDTSQQIFIPHMQQTDAISTAATIAEDTAAAAAAAGMAVEEDLDFNPDLEDLLASDVNELLANNELFTLPPAPLTTTTATNTAAATTTAAAAPIAVSTNKVNGSFDGNSYTNIQQQQQQQQQHDHKRKNMLRDPRSRSNSSNLTARLNPALEANVAVGASLSMKGANYFGTGRSPHANSISNSGNSRQRGNVSAAVGSGAKSSARKHSNTTSRSTSTTAAAAALSISSRAIVTGSLEPSSLYSNFLSSTNTTSSGSSNSNSNSSGSSSNSNSNSYITSKSSRQTITPDGSPTDSVALQFSSVDEAAIAALTQTPIALFQAFNGGDLDRVKDIIKSIATPGCRFKTPALDGFLMGPQYVMDFFDAVYDVHPDAVLVAKKCKYNADTQEITCKMYFAGTRITTPQAAAADTFTQQLHLHSSPQLHKQQQQKEEDEDGLYANLSKQYLFKRRGSSLLDEMDVTALSQAEIDAMKELEQLGRNLSVFGKGSILLGVTGLNHNNFNNSGTTTDTTDTTNTAATNNVTADNTITNNNKNNKNNNAAVTEIADAGNNSNSSSSVTGTTTTSQQMQQQAQQPQQQQQQQQLQAQIDRFEFDWKVSSFRVADI